MKDQTIIQAMTLQDQATRSLREEFRIMQKVLDRTYIQSMTHVMMWDVLFGLMQEKGLFTKTQFDEALAELSKKTQAALEAAVKAPGEPEKPLIP